MTVNSMDLESAHSIRNGIFIGRTVMLTVYILVCLMFFMMAAPEAFSGTENQYTDEFRSATILLPLSAIGWVVHYSKTNDIRTPHKNLMIALGVSCGIDLIGGVTAVITLASRGEMLGPMFLIGIILLDGIRVLLTVLTEKCNRVICSYWICSCGFANIYGANFCGKCGAQNPYIAHQQHADAQQNGS